MYPTITHQIAQARIADMRNQARQDALAHEARQSRRAHKSPFGRHLLRRPVLAARRALTA
jgi:hypothetical protein